MYGSDYWLKEEKTDMNVRRAFELADEARIALKKTYNFSNRDAEPEYKKAVNCIEKINAVFSGKPEAYRNDFFWCHRSSNDVSLNVEVYFQATVLSFGLNKFKDSADYAKKGYDAAFGSDRDGDIDRLKIFRSYLDRSNKELYKNTSEGRTAEKQKQRIKNFEKVSNVFFWIFRIAFIIGTPVAGGLMVNPEWVTSVSFAYLFVIAALTFFYLLSGKEEETWIRPIILAPFGFVLISISYYIMGGGYKVYDLMLPYLFKQFVFAVGAVLAGGILAFAVAQWLGKKKIFSLYS